MANLHVPSAAMSFGGSEFWRGVWRLVDPKIALASIVPLISAIALAHLDGAVIPFGIALAAFALLLAIEVAKNAVNDLYDFRSGADTKLREDERTPFSGGKRVLVDHLLSETDLLIISIIATWIAVIIGLPLALWTQPVLLVLGILGALIAIEYTAPPLKLSYRGLGETAVFLTYGPGIFLGTYFLFRGTITTTAVVASVAVGFLIANVLVLNEFPDERADRDAGKRTLVVRLGRGGATWLAVGLFAAAFAAPIVGVASGATTMRLLGFLAAAPIAMLASVRLIQTRTGPPVEAQALTLATYVLAGMGLTITLLLH